MAIKPSPGAASAAGYSGTPLAKKLGLKPAMTLCVIDSPRPYEQIVDGLPAPLRFVARAGATTNLVHLFAQKEARLQQVLGALRETLRADAVVWVSWPKKASGIASEVDENSVRRVALPLGWVDVKVCAVNAMWSGLKLVVRKALR
jgi:hypothetical protein